MADESAHLPGRPLWLAFLPDFLFEIDPKPVRYVLKAWLLVLLPTMFLSGAVNLLLHPARQPNVPVAGAAEILFLVVATPVLETLIMALVLAGLSRLMSAGPAATASAILWGLLHGMAAPAWGLVAWWPFLIMSIAFLTWRHLGLSPALTIAASIHALQNGFAAAILVLLRYVQ
jgi:membrane protease YdiL (CAAX protease family)